jgi:hypothetical protein
MAIACADVHITVQVTNYPVFLNKQFVYSYQLPFSVSEMQNAMVE